MQLGEVLQIVSVLAASVAAIAAWRVACHTSTSWETAQDAVAFDRLVRQPMIAATLSYKREIRRILQDHEAISDDELSKIVGDLNRRYVRSVRPLRSVEYFDLSEVTKALEKILEECEDEVTMYFGCNHHKKPLMADTIDSILRAHHSKLTDFVERCDPGSPQLRRKIAPTLSAGLDG